MTNAARTDVQPLSAEHKALVSPDVLEYRRAVQATMEAKKRESAALDRVFRMAKVINPELGQNGVKFDTDDLTFYREAEPAS